MNGFPGFFSKISTQLFPWELPEREEKKRLQRRVAKERRRRSREVDGGLSEGRKVGGRKVERSGEARRRSEGRRSKVGRSREAGRRSEGQGRAQRVTLQ